MWRSWSRVGFVVIGVAGICSFPASSDAQQRYSPRARQAMIEYQRALQAQNQYYAQRDRALRNAQWGVRASTFVGSMAAGGPVRSTYGLLAWGAYAGGGMAARYGAQKMIERHVFSRPTIQQWNNRLYFGY
jgi:hypothetical protein